MESRNGKEQALDGLCNTGAVGVGECVEKGSTALAAINTLTGSSDSISFDSMLPVRTKKDVRRVGWKILRGAIHL